MQFIRQYPDTSRNALIRGRSRPPEFSEVVGFFCRVLALINCETSRGPRVSSLPPPLPPPVTMPTVILRSSRNRRIPSLSIHPHPPHRGGFFPPVPISLPFSLDPSPTGCRKLVFLFIMFPYASPLFAWAPFLVPTPPT